MLLFLPPPGLAGMVPHQGNGPMPGSAPRQRPGSPPGKQPAPPWDTVRRPAAPKTRRQHEPLSAFLARTGLRKPFLLHAFGLGSRLSRPAPRQLGRQGLPLPHRRGPARAAAELQHRRRTHRRTGADPARHGRIGRQHADTGLCWRTVRRRPAAGCQPLLHHPARRHRHRQILQAVRRAARRIPQIQLCGHGRCAVPPGEGAPGRQTPARDHRQFDGRHADLDLGQQVPGLHGRAGAHGFPAQRNVQPQLDDAPPDHRLDPQRPRLGQRQLHKAAAQRAVRFGVFWHRHQRRQSGTVQGGADARESRSVAGSAPEGAFHCRRQ
eukprot:Opistho-1_new@101229